MKSMHSNFIDSIRSTREPVDQEQVEHDCGDYYDNNMLAPVLTLPQSWNWYLFCTLCWHWANSSPMWYYHA